MELTFKSLKDSILLYIRNNIGICALFIFLFIAGLAAGISMVQTTYAGAARQTLLVLPEIFQSEAISFGSFLLISLSVHVLFCSLLFLSATWLPLAVLWPASALLRGIVTGTGLGACILSWPSMTATILLLLIWFDVAAMLPPLLRIGILSGREISARLLKAAEDEPANSGYFRQCIGSFSWLIVSIFLEGIVFPLSLYWFC